MIRKKERSRKGCRNCKKRRIKCDELKPRCRNCVKREIDHCDYTPVLKWANVSFKPEKNSKNVSSELMKTVQEKDGTLEETHPGDTCLENNDSSGLEGSFENALTKPESLIAHPIISQSYFTVLRPGEDNDLFKYFIEQAPFLLSVNLPQTLNNDPFFNFFPILALTNTLVMKALVTFSASHIDRLRQLNSDYENPEGTDESRLQKRYPSNSQVPRLLKETLRELIPRITDKNYKFNDETLSAVFLLVAADLCFANRDALTGQTMAINKWQHQLNVAKSLIYQRPVNSAPHLLDSFFPDDRSSFAFFKLWLNFIEIIGSLSRAKPTLNTDSLAFASYQLAIFEDDHEISSKRKKLRDIHECTGLEYRVLSYLGKIAILIEKSSVSVHPNSEEILIEALELQEEIFDYLERGEKEREIIKNSGGFTGSQLTFYENLQTINAAQCLSGILQLKRRVLGIGFASPAAKKLIRRISDIIEKNATFYSSTESSTLFSIFVCGSDLIDDDMKDLRPLFRSHLQAMQKLGLISAREGLVVMEQCWVRKQSWWEVMEEMGIEVSFAI